MLLHMATIISRDQLYDIVPTANNMVLYSSKFIKKIDFLCVLMKKEGYKGT